MVSPAIEEHAPAAERRWRFSADDFLRIAQAGILTEDDRVELVRGEILQVTPQGPEHSSLKGELHERLADAYRSLGFRILDQSPFRAGPQGVPEPDLAVVRGRARDYLHRHPEGADALLVVEIAKTSQSRDRAKACDYALGGVPVYWLLDLEGGTLDVYCEPDRERGRYKRIVSLGEGESVALPEIGVEWRVGAMLP